MLEVAIVGGGLSGLALADSLHAQGKRFALFEARPRLGGRILTETCAANGLAAGLAVDIGPSWYWPDTQPQMTRLVAELGLAHFAQHDNNMVLRLNEGDQPPEAVPADALHGGARRLAGGMAALVQALGVRLPADSLHLEHVLTSVQDRGDHVELHFDWNGVAVPIKARQVVLALPPRLLDQHVRFAPAMDARLREAMRATPTHMAAQAKVVIAYDSATWRAAGHAGNAFVTHEQAVLGQIFDACDADGGKAALGGFVALSPALRASFHDGLPMLMASQMAQVFGPALNFDTGAGGEQHYRDWAREAHTCSVLDLAPPAGYAEYGNPLLRKPLWGGKLFLGGAETAAYAGGYLEGALEAATRIAREISHASPVARTTPAEGAANGIARFGAWVATARAGGLQRYRDLLNQALAAQMREQLTQRALLATVEQIYSAALRELDELPLDTSGVTIEHGRSALTPAVIEPFDGFINTLLDEALRFNRGSCALSNFPVEHSPDGEYVNTIRRDLVAAWREFVWSANSLLVSKNAWQGVANG